MRTEKQWLSNTINRIFWASFLILAVFIYTPSSLAIPVDAVPFHLKSISRSWVTDMADLLSHNTEVKLNALITDLYQKTRSKVKVVTVPDTPPSSTPKQFAIDLFKYWNIDNYGNNYGVLFLISKGDRRVEIRTGSTTVKILPDQQVQAIIDKEITPKFKQSNYDEGTLAGTKSIVLALQPNKSKQNDLLGTDYQFENNHFAETNKPTPKLYEGNNYFVNILILLLIILVMGGMFLLFVFGIYKTDYSGNNSSQAKRSRSSDSSSDYGSYDFGSSDSGGDGGGGGGDW